MLQPAPSWCFFNSGHIEGPHPAGTVVACCVPMLGATATSDAANDGDDTSLGLKLGDSCLLSLALMVEFDLL